MQRRIIHALSPFTSHLRRLFIRTGGCHVKTELLSKSGRDLLVRAQLPMLLDRTHPLFALRMLAIINDQFYFSELAAQGEASMLSLAEGEKPRCVGLRA